MWQKIKNYQETNYLRWNAFTFVGILLIIICGIKVTHGLEHYMDLLFWDESLYLTRGTQMFHSIPRDWGPTYSLWYKILSFFISDKVELYYFNFKFTTILVSISLFLLMLSVGIQRVLAFILAVFSLCTFINLPVWPHVSHYCVFVLISGIIVSKYQKTLVSRFAVLTFALLICAYSRPELFLAFLPVFLLTYFFFFIKIKEATKKDIALVVILTLLSLLVYRFFKTPFNNGDSQRGIGVFLQHFALNYSQWYPSKSPFWLDFFEIIQKEFHGATTFKGLIAANPELIERHFMSNIVFYFSQLGKIIFSFFAPIFTKEIHWLSLMICTMLWGVYLSFTKSTKHKRKRIFILIKNNLITIFVLMLVTFPSVIVCIYAYPRSHYLLLQVPFLLIIIAILISSIVVEIAKPIQKIVVIATIWFFVMPVAEDFTYFTMFRKEDSLANLQTVKYVKKNLMTKDTVRMFDVEGGMINFLPLNFTNEYYLWKRDTQLLSDFILKQNFDIIYKTPTLSDLNCVQKDSVLFDLLNNPDKYGYYNQKIGDFTPSLLIKKK